MLTSTQTETLRVNKPLHLMVYSRRRLRWAWRLGEGWHECIAITRKLVQNPIFCNYLFCKHTIIVHRIAEYECTVKLAFSTYSHRHTKNASTWTNITVCARTERKLMLQKNKPDVPSFAQKVFTHFVFFINGTGWRTVVITSWDGRVTHRTWRRDKVQWITS